MKSQLSTISRHISSKNILLSKSLVKKLFILSIFFFTPFFTAVHVFANCTPWGLDMPEGASWKFYLIPDNNPVRTYPDDCESYAGYFGCSGTSLLNYTPGGNYYQSCSYAAPTVSVYWSPSTISKGQTSTIYSYSTGASSCTTSGNFWNSAAGTSNGYWSSNTSPTVSSRGTYGQTATCYNPSGGSASASATFYVQGDNCSSPWGSVGDGYSNTAYSASSADSCAAISQVRSCNDGSMSGSYTFTSCTNKQTTLTTGTDPSSTTISPDYGYGTNVNTFTFQTNVVTDTITTLVINLTNASATSLVEITDNSGNGVLGSISNPAASSTHSITLSTPITANTSLTSYKIRIWPKSHANLPSGSLGMMYPVTAKVLSWTGTNSTKLGSDTATTVVTIDNEMQSTTGSAGITWATSTSAADNIWNGIAYGNGVFVAVSTSDSGTINNRVMTSTDGITWTARTAAANLNWSAVTFGNGLFVAVSTFGTGNRVMTSPDGITWTSRTSAADNNWRSVTYGKGLFVAVANSGTGNRVMTSPDGITWTSRNAAGDSDWVSVTYGNGTFVAVYSGFCSGSCAMTSLDGITWTSRTTISNAWTSVTYGNGLFVAVAGSGTGNRVMTSPDGITWTSRTSSSDIYWRSVTYGNGVFVAVACGASSAQICNSTAGNRVMTSPDGITWTTRTSSADNQWISVAYGYGLFAAVSQTGSGNRVMTSTSSIPTVSSVGANQVTINYTNPGDSDTHSILVLHATSTITDIPVDGTTYATGTSIGAATVGCVDTTIATSTADSCTVNNLSGNTSYYFSLFTKDNYGNYSKVFLPSPVSTTTLVSNPSNVSVISGDRKATIVYTTPSDSNQQGIVILQGTSTISQTPVDGVNYTSGTALGTSTFVCVNPDVGASTISSCDITGLTNGTTYHFKIFTKSSANKYSVGVVPTNSPATPRVPAVVDATALTGNGNAIISYVTSSSANQGGVVVLKSTTPITIAPTDGITYSIGNSLPVGQVAYTTAGSYNWTVPSGVTSISTVVVGAGGGGKIVGGSGVASGGGGGGLGYINNISVTPGQSISIIVGSSGYDGSSGGLSQLSTGPSYLVVTGGSGGTGGVSGSAYNGGSGGVISSSVGGTSNGGGAGGAGGNEGGSAQYFSGGGGAGGYSGAGGNGGGGTANGTSGSGGGGGGGQGVYVGASSWSPNGGGGVGILGKGTNGGGSGGGGSGGGNGSSIAIGNYALGGTYGGGGGADSSYYGGNTSGGSGAVRIIWGSGRSFPSTNTSDQPSVEVACVDNVSTPNTASGCDVTGLSNGTPYYFAVFARSSIDGAYSTSSSPSGSPVTPGIVTVLGSGTDPVSVTIAPPLEATSPTVVDSFTLQSGAGTDVVSSVVVALTNASSTSQIQITNDTGSIVYGTTANPTGATTSIALSTNTLTSNTTLTQYKIRITPKDQSGLPAQALGAIYAVAARVESFVSSLPHTGSDSSSATVSIDNLSASEVTTETLVAGDGKITVNYTAPSDSDYSNILFLRKTSAITDVPIDGMSYTAGNALGSSVVGCVDTQAISGGVSSCQITGLTNGVPYYIKIFTRDIYGNWSAGYTPPGTKTPAVLTTSVRVDSYRLRNDDGTETTATYSSSENTGNSSTFLVGDKTRIRFAVENETPTQTTKSYSLEYSSGVCSVWTSVPRKIDATTQHWKIEPSSFVPDNAVTTHSSGISVPTGQVGLRTFTPGRVQTFNRATQPITLLANEYTEVEFSIRSTGYLETNTNYCFRLTDQGENSDFVYSQNLEISPMSRSLRYYGGGGGGGGLITVESATVLATTTYVGGVASSTTATSTNLGETSVATTTTSTTTPRRGGGSDGDVGLLLDLRNSFAFNPSVGSVLGDAFAPMCSDMQHRMKFGSTDKSTNGEVSQLQYYLSERGYFTGKITGAYFEKTRKAVEEFQRDNNLIVTGISGKITRAKMRDISCVR